MLSTSNDPGDGAPRPDVIQGAIARAGGLVGWRPLLLVAAVAGYLLLVAVLLSGTLGIVPAVLIAVAVATLGPRLSPDSVVALYRAELLGAGQGAGLHEAVATLADRAGLAAPPAVAIVPSLAVGAFSAGPGGGPSPRYAILLTEGLLRRHTLSELAAVLAHEIAHIRSGDLPLFALADTVTRLAQGLFYAGVALVLVSLGLWLVDEDPFSPLAMAVMLAAPALSSALQLALPREHDMMADVLAANLVGNAQWVAQVAETEPAEPGSPLDDWRLPVPQRRVPLPSPLRCHLDGPMRAERLRAMADDLPLMAPLTLRDTPMISLAGAGPIEMRPRDRWPGLWF